MALPDLFDPASQFNWALALAGLSLFFWLRGLFAGIGKKRPGRRIILDGSNVMYWRDDTPKLDTLRQIIQALKTHNYTPVVIFDANVGYRLRDRYLHDDDMANLLGLPCKQVMVVPKGTPADGHILRAARDLKAPIVTNDRYRDWVTEFPEVKSEQHLIQGGFRDGALYLKLPDQK